MVQIRHASPKPKVELNPCLIWMFDYALEYEITDRNYARTFNIPDDVKKAKTKTNLGGIPFYPGRNG